MIFALKAVGIVFDSLFMADMMAPEFLNKICKNKIEGIDRFYIFASVTIWSQISIMIIRATQ